MSSVTLITTIIVLLAVLVCYAFISQTLRHKKEQRERLLAALLRRKRTFTFMVNGFPHGFLSKELTLLVQRSLIDTLEQLARIDRRADHVQDLQLVSNQMMETQRRTGPHNPPSLESQQQIKEVKMCLEELYKFVFISERKGNIQPNQAEAFRSQIKQLVLQITVDSYVMRGKHALQNDKLRLAHHYYDLAVKLLVREGRGGLHDKRLSELQALLSELEAELMKVDGSPGLTDSDRAEQEALDSEWEKFVEKDDIWKKKHAYD